MKKIYLLLLLSCAQPLCAAEQSKEDVVQIAFARVILKSVGYFLIGIGNALVLASEGHITVITKNGMLTDSILEKLNEQLNYDAWHKIGFGAKAGNRTKVLDVKHPGVVKTERSLGTISKPGYTSTSFTIEKKNGEVVIDYTSTKVFDKTLNQARKKLLQKKFTKISKQTNDELVGSYGDAYTNCKVLVTRNDQGNAVKKQECKIQMAAEPFLSMMKNNG